MGNGNASVALQDKLTRCERQLGDWRACPSGKTPEGKRIIQNLEAQIRSIESRVAGNDSTSNQELARAPAGSSAPGPGSIGGLVNVFA